MGSFYPRLPESVPGPLRSAPSLRKQAALDGIGSRNIYFEVYFFFFQFDHTNDLYGFQYWRLIFKDKDLSMQPDLPGNLSLLVLIIQRAQHAAPPAGELSLPIVQRVQHAAPNLSLLVLQSSTSSPTKATYVAPYSRRHRRFSPSNAAALTRH